jgi:hypothetical protein
MVVMVAIIACSDVSSAIGQRFRGKTLDVVIMSIERQSEVLFPVTYRTGGTKVSSRCDPADPNDSGQIEPVSIETKHWKLTPSSDKLGLVMLKLKVENHTATNAVVNIDEKSAELRDFVRGRYTPVNVNNSMEEVGEPENPYEERPMVFLWNKLSSDGNERAIELRKGCGLEGWMVFEAPLDTKFREFKWQAGDSLTIEF